MPRRTKSLAQWSSTVHAVAILASGEIGCHEALTEPTYTLAPAQPLEMVPFGALGPAKVAFERVSIDTTPGAWYSAVYLADGTTRVSKVAVRIVAGKNRGMAAVERNARAMDDGERPQLVSALRREPYTRIVATGCPGLITVATTAFHNGCPHV